MDISKDISLVNSDNESSIVNPIDDASIEQLQELINGLQEQLKAKDCNVAEIQTSLDRQKQTIESLENSGKQLQELVDSSNEKLSHIEGENEYLKSTIISLKSIIEGQKQQLETAQKDIEQHNSTIEKLQEQLDDRENILCGKIDDIALEKMIANENKVIANNQNLNNIILFFKAALETKNGEINNLKSLIKKNDELESVNVTFKNQLDFKGRQMSTLIAEVETLKEQTIENIEMISRLISTETLLNNKLSNLQKENDSLQKLNQEKCIQIQNLEEDNDKLSRAIAEKQVEEQETNLNEEMEQVRNELGLKEQETYDLKKIVGDLQSKVNEFTIRQNEYINRDEGYIQQIGQLSQFIEGLRNVLEVKNQELLVLQARVDKTDDEKNMLSLQNEDYLQQMSTLSTELEIISKEILAKNENIRELELKLSESMCIKSKIEGLAQEQSVVINMNEELTKKIVHLTEELDESQKLLAVKGHEVEEIQRVFNDVQEENTNIKSKFEKLVNERDSIVLSKEKLSEQILQLSDHLAKNQQELELKEQDICNLQMSLCENNKKYSDIQIQLEECRQDNQNLLCKNEKVSLNVLQLMNELGATQKDNELKEQVIIDLETKLDNANGAKAALQLQVEESNHASAEIMRCNDSLSQQIKELTEVRDKVNNEIHIKKQEITDLLTKLNTADEDSRNNEILQSQIEKLHEENDELMRRNDSSLQYVKGLNEEIDTLRKEVEERNNYINDLETKLKESENKNIVLSINQAQLEELSNIRHDLVSQNENFKKETMQLIEKFNNLRSELDIKSQDIIELQSKLNDIEENNKNLRNELLSKENMISSLQDRITSLYIEIETLTQSQEVGWRNSVNEIDSLKSEIQTKKNKIEELECNIKDMELTLEEQFKKSTDMQQKLEEAVNNISIKVFECAKDLKIENKSTNSDEIDIDCMLNVFRNHVISLIEANDNECKKIKQMLVTAQRDILELTQTNAKLMSEYSDIAIKNRDLYSELEKVGNLNRDLIKTTEFMVYLKSELSDKSNELTGMETKVHAWKDQLTYYENLMTKQMIDLKLEKDNLEDLQKIWQRTSIRHNSPQSLLTICCNKIIETLQFKDITEPNKHHSESNMDSCDATFLDSKSSIELRHVESRTNICICPELTLELQLAKKENEELNNIVKNLKSSNRYLLEEREEVRKEIQQLMEPSIDLQKKITNHRTNLSTLTATTYAENKLLNSQLKVLKHYHTRYIHVCQRDIPAVKSQLHELMSILRDNSSLPDKQNSSFKRYSLPDVLDNNSMISNCKNDSTLDGDLLMLDTNVTLTINADNTLIGHDQTCLDVTQIHFDSEVACQTNELSKVVDSCALYSQIESLTNDNQQMIEILEAFKEENAKLKEDVNNQRTDKDSIRSVDAQSSPIKCSETCNDSISKKICEKCKQEEELDKLLHQMKNLTQELQEAISQKTDIETKYNDLVLEIPAVNALAKKLNNKEIECQNKMQEVANLTEDLSKKNNIIRELEEENVSLSTQVMDGISEADDLKKELDTLKVSYSNLEEKCAHLEKVTKESGINLKENIICSQCAIKDNIIKSLNNRQTIDLHSKLNRSLSDSESSSRHNKLSTLQSELHASKEDCKKITEEVATMKNHLERSNLSMSQPMDLDESMSDSNIFSCIGFKSDEQHVHRFMSNIPEERPLDSYTLDKIDCFNFYADKTGIEKENISNDIKIVDVLRMLHDNLFAKHGNEVENLLNRLKDFEETKNQLQSQIGNITAENLRLTKSLDEKDNKEKSITNVFTQIRSNLNAIHEISNENQSSVMTLFKDNYLRVLDTALDLSSKSMFESLIDCMVDKHKHDLSNMMEKYTKLHEQMESVLVEFNGVCENLKDIKERLSSKEVEYNLLKDQNERIHEISNAVTLDIVNRDRELGEIVKNSYDRLITLNILRADDIGPNLNTNEKIKLLLDLLSRSVIEIKSEADKLQDLENLKTAEEVKQKELESLTSELEQKETSLRSQTDLYNELIKIHQSTLERHDNKMKQLIANIKILKDTVSKKEELIQILDGKLSSKLEESFSESINEFMQKIQSLEQENSKLKSVNQIITKENEIVALELEKSAEIIRNNKVDIDKMTADILVLRETVADNMSVVESLTLESKSLQKNNMVLKKQYDEKCQDCTRLETSIKILEKTAEIQNKTIMR